MLEQALADAEASHSALVECAQDGILVADAQSQRFVHTNDAMCRMLGYPRDTVLALGFSDIHPPAALAEVREKFERQLSGESPLARDVPVLRSDGSVFVADVHSAPVSYRGKRCLLGIFRDMTERQQMQEQLQELNLELQGLATQRTSELEAANQELEAFAYSVAHELRAPLRAVEGYTRILLQDAGGTLNDKARTYMLRASSEALRMARLIDDLLKLSRATRAELHYYDVDLNVMARELVEERRRSDPDRGARVTVEANLTVRGDPGLLREALDALIDNAWKFASGRPDPRIEVGETVVDGQPTLVVRDNGVGFDPRLVAKAFAPFGRLHAMDEFPGSGVGLTLAQRIVSRHGGRIWIESTPGEGTTVFVALPQRNRPEPV